MFSGVKTRTWDQDTPNDGNFFDDEFDNIYSDLNDLDTRITALNTTKTSGIIQGGIKFKTTSLPPTIKAGSYGVNGVVVDLDADLDINLSDTLRVPGSSGKTSVALDTNFWYGIFLDEDGNAYYGHYGEKVVVSGTVSSIAGSGTTKTFTVNTAGSHNKKLLVVSDSNGFLLATKITGGNGSTTYTGETLTGTITPVGATTFVVYERIATLHITGASLAITTDANIPVYSPSCGTNGWDAGSVELVKAKNGFYPVATNITEQRMIGAFCTDNSGNVLYNSLISFGQGDDKRDNSFRLQDEVGLASTATKVGYFTNYDLLRGNDYLIENDSVDGMRFTVKRTCLVSATFTDNNKNCLLALNATDVTTTAATNPSTALDRFMAPNSGMSFSNQCNKVLYPDDYLIEIGDGGLATRPGDVMFQGVLEIR